MKFSRIVPVLLGAGMAYTLLDDPRKTGEVEPAVMAPKVEKVEKVENHTEGNPARPSKLGDRAPKNPSIEEAKAQVLARLTQCQSEFEDYWDSRAEQGETAKSTQEALEVYNGCQERIVAKQNEEEREAQGIAWDVYESVQSYREHVKDQQTQKEGDSDLANAIQACTHANVEYKGDFLWQLNPEGEVQGLGTFPGWQVVIEGTTYSLMSFQDSDGEERYTYRSLTADQQRAGSSGGRFDSIERLCQTLSPENSLQ